jgi:hypothetical protein
MLSSEKEFAVYCLLRGGWSEVSSRGGRHGGSLVSVATVVGKKGGDSSSSLIVWIGLKVKRYNVIRGKQF